MSPIQFQIMSDLHLETPSARPTYQHFKIKPECRYLAFLGNIGNVLDYDLIAFLEDQLRVFEIVFFVQGNHEAYGTKVMAAVVTMLCFQRTMDDFRGEGRDVLGSTLFSRIINEQRESVSLFCSDFSEISEWDVNTHNASHQKDLTWLNSQVEQITREDANQVRLWAFGHTHFNCDFEEVGTGKRIVANQKGYKESEVATFDVAKVVEIESFEAPSQGTLSNMLKCNTCRSVSESLKKCAGCASAFTRERGGLSVRLFIPLTSLVNQLGGSQDFNVIPESRYPLPNLQTALSPNVKYQPKHQQMLRMYKFSNPPLTQSSIEINVGFSYYLSLNDVPAQLLLHSQSIWLIPEKINTTSSLAKALAIEFSLLRGFVTLDEEDDRTAVVRLIPECIETLHKPSNLMHTIRDSIVCILPALVCLKAIVSPSHFSDRLIRCHYAHVAVEFPWILKLASSVRSIDPSIILHTSVCPNFDFSK
ncbi:Ser/Thr protein phosphatase [Sclerotinia borealis F-4128]|uniref:Ser/Thr protein phosphatase n=1 Tax=Sclerotinia borealis (strain F-4128) TaxID=1432307 RepID=W9CU21_SCLBF|nr:Ser/Thr protein phosphatase [Sclerotinia borealis F-4128]